ncbi:MAG: ArsA family ATPase [Dehalococcoidia bacterium]
MRIILYTGKGGVGKTSVAAATALRSAQLGYRTLVMSTDAAHSLGDSLETALTAEPRPIAQHLWAQEVDVTREIDVHWGTLQRWVTTLLSWRGVSEIMAQEMAVLPGMEELASLIYLVNYHDSGDYDVAIVDCAPTGETLRLLSLPDTLRWWMERFFPIERAVARAVRPVITRLTDLPMPDDEVYESIQVLYSNLAHMHAILSDAATSSVRLVVTPEKMVIKEAQRAFTYLNLFGYATDVVVCNRVMPQGVGDEYFAAWKESQERYLRQVEEAFSPLPILRAPLLEREVVGLAMLEELAQDLYGDHNPTQLYYQGHTQEIRSVDGGYVMTISLPFASKEQVSLVQTGNELVVRVGGYRRNIILPRTLVGMEGLAAKLEGNTLRIRFVAPGAAGEE